jgi:hypothetical protein
MTMKMNKLPNIHPGEEPEEGQKTISEDLIVIHPLAQVTTESHA